MDPCCEPHISHSSPPSSRQRLLEGIEVAKSHRAIPDKGKGKARDKTKPTSKPLNESGPVFEYHEGSVQDEAIRSLLLRGYEQFKVFELHDDDDLSLRVGSFLT